jgi:Rrf2 family protein
MKITSSIEYATRLMVTLGRHHGESAIAAEKLSAADGVPSDYVNQLLLRLRRAGLVESHRGTGGGYALSRPPADITLGQVIRAVDGKVFEDVCEKYEDGRKDCHHQGNCSISPVWKRLGKLVENYVDGVTLSSIMETKPGACGAQFSFMKEGSA